MSVGSSISVAITRKNSCEEVRIELSNFHRYDLVSLRVWTEPRSGAADRISTQSGLPFRVELLPELIEALCKAEAEARSASLLR